MELFPNATHEAELRAAIDDLERGLAALPLPKAINRIHGWKRRLEDSERAELREIAEGLEELAGLLVGAELDALAIGECLQRLGQQTAAAAENAPPVVSAGVARLGDLLLHAGGAMAANARNAAELDEGADDAGGVDA